MTFDEMQFGGDEVARMDAADDVAALDEAERAARREGLVLRLMGASEDIRKAEDALRLAEAAHNILRAGLAAARLQDAMEAYSRILADWQEG